jgi:protein involved in polysaccharide export with SLBB domain
MRRRGRFLKVWLVFFSVALFSGLASAQSKSAEGADKILLGAGDKIVVRIPIEPKLSGEYTVDENGKFFLPIVDQGLDLGAFKVADLTPAQAADMIKQSMDEYYNDSEVTVELVASGARLGQAVSVFGLVNNPGAYRYYNGMRMLDMFLNIRGFLDGADLSHIALYRGQEAVRYIDVRGIISGTDLTNNIEVKAGDYFIIPRIEPAMNMKVILLGSVARPGTAFVPEGIQLLDLIARNGGFAKGAALSKTYIIRIIDGKPVVIHSDLKALIDLQDLKENVAIKDGDIVFIPENSRVKISNIVNSLMQLSFIRNSWDTINGNNNN